MASAWPEKFSHLDFALPEELIAKEPVTPADHARLMVIDRKAGSITHDYFYNLGKYISAGDAIFYNATRVESRRVFLKRANSEKLFECVFLKVAPPPRPPSPQRGEGGEGEVFLHSGGTALAPLSTTWRGAGGEAWRVLMRNIRSLKDGARLHAAKDTAYEFTLQRDGGGVFLICNRPLAAEDFARIGEMPIPPYMKRPAGPQDSETYQNFFKNQIAEKEKILGSAASPTAALHFTPALYDSMRGSGIEFYPVCLDIGYGTFAPVSDENFRENRLHAEHYYIPPGTQVKLTNTGGRKIALGTTALRAVLSYQRYEKNEGETDIFVQPGEAIHGIDGLITNFHLPQSSLILLTAAFCGDKLLMQAYAEAIAQGYRFYSYGDAMLTL